MDELHAVVESKLAAIGLRHTSGRRLLVDLLTRGDGPLSIAAIADLDPTLPTSSIYRNLAVLEEIGCVRRLSSADGAVLFELAEELTEHHHHLVCTGCGSVVDFAMPFALERALDRSIEAVAESAGFKVESHQLDLIGRCRRCS